MGCPYGHCEVDTKTFKPKKLDLIPMSGDCFFWEFPSDEVWYVKGDTKKRLSKLSVWGSAISQDGRAIALVSEKGEQYRQLSVYVEGAEAPMKVFEIFKPLMPFIRWNDE